MKDGTREKEKRWNLFLAVMPNLLLILLNFGKGYEINMLKLKRFLAYLIDNCIFVIPLFIIFSLPGMPTLEDVMFVRFFEGEPWQVQLPTGMLVFWAYLILRDLILRNGSIGKKVLGLAILDREGKRPSLGTMLKYSALMGMFEGAYLFIWILIHPDWTDRFETKVFGARLVDTRRNEDAMGKIDHPAERENENGNGK